MVKKGSGWHGEPKRHSEAVKKGLKTRFSTTKKKPKTSTRKMTPKGIPKLDSFMREKFKTKLDLEFKKLFNKYYKTQKGTWFRNNLIKEFASLHPTKYKTDKDIDTLIEKYDYLDFEKLARKGKVDINKYL